MNIAAWCMMVLVATSCSKYNIQGASDIQDADGHMLFLRDFADGKYVSMDSCDMVHGKFSFSGPLDSVQVVQLFLESEFVMPVVLETGDININLSMRGFSCTGTELNDTLNAFNKRYDGLIMRMEDTERQYNQAIMNGFTEEDATIQRDRAQQPLVVEEDRMVTKFISENFDNCLGPFEFLFFTSQIYDFPMMTPWVESLMMKATPAFKNNPGVREYIRAAEHNREIMNGR